MHRILDTLWRVAAALVLVGCANSSPHANQNNNSNTVHQLDGGQADAAVSCTSDFQCDDGIACTIDHCVEGECVNEPCVDCCGDGLVCRPDYGCGHAPNPCSVDMECDDGIRCTLDRCFDQTYCENLAQDALCEEGEICLSALGCIPEPPSSCVDDSDCYAGQPCLGEWHCDQEFGCQFISVMDCTDGDPCTDDLCDPGTGQCANPIRDGDDDGYGDILCGGTDCVDDDPDINPGETELCNTIDDNCDGDIDEIFDCSPPLSTEPCTTTCDSSGIKTCDNLCGWGDCIPPAETCNGVDDDCDTVCDNGFACCAGQVADCDQVGNWYAGTAVCLMNCNGWNMNACHNCGNGQIDSPEECDGNALGGNECSDVSSSYTGGTLDCYSDCTFDTSGCEEGWDPTGVYIVNPPVSDNCLASLVDWSFTQLTFFDNGTFLLVSGSRCQMQGPSAVGGTIDVECTLTGTCNETFSLVGTFDSSDHWTGTFTATFTPNGGSCYDCTTTSYPIEGQR